MIYLDFETRSAIKLDDAGSWRYARDPSTSILCLAWTVDDGPVEVWTPAEKFPKGLAKAINSGELVEAHNAAFERAIWTSIGIPRHGFPEIPFERWRCSMARAATLGLPQSLEGLAKALEIAERKDEEGKKAMRRASSPLPRRAGASLFDDGGPVEFDEDPELLRRVVEYCRQDVWTERAASKLLPDLSPTELDVWLLDQELNDRGIKIDRQLCERAVYFVEAESRRFSDELVELTDGKVGAPTELEAIKNWLRSTGVETPTLDEKTVSRLLGSPKLTEAARRVLEIRQLAGRSSVAKFRSMLDRADPEDDRVRNNLRYHGAGPGRWAGSGVQIQNFPRGSVEDVETLAETFRSGSIEDVELLFGDPITASVSALRPALVADGGKTFCVWDFAQIEARLLAWYAGCEKLVELFASGSDVYKSFAAEAFRKPVGQVTKPERFIGKISVLGLGYQMGAPKLVATFAGFGVRVDETLAGRLVSTYRGAYPEIPALWRRLEDNALKAAVSTFTPVDRFGAFERRGRFLFYKLPSGREIAYLDPRVEGGKLVYKKTLGKQLAKESSYGGKLTENVIQATARDVLAEGMLRLKSAGFSLVATIHDEIVSEEPESSASGKLEKGKELLEERPDWTTAPLAVEGFTSRRYKK